MLVAHLPSTRLVLARYMPKSFELWIGGTSLKNRPDIPSYINNSGKIATSGLVGTSLSIIDIGADFDTKRLSIHSLESGPNG
jgi:hypothetical protein